MPGPTNGSVVAHFQQTLQKYLEANKRNARELIAKKAKSFTIEAYKGMKAVAPTPAKIKADVLALGWRVKRRPGPWPYKKGEKRGSLGPLNRMRSSVIRRRQRAIGSAASGYIPALNALGASVPGQDAQRFSHPQGTLEIIAGNGSTTGIAVANQMPGCVRVEKEHQITDAALKVIDADMQQYIDRKQQETARAVQN